jgi:hypothetical protein
VLGGAGVAGIALVAGGGSDDAPAVAPAPAPSAPPLAAPTPSPTPTPRCGYRARPGVQSFPAAGGSGTCQISTAAQCAWTAQSNVPWIQLKGRNQDSGTGSVRFDVARNTGPARRGFVRLRDDEEVRCQVDQAQGGYVPPGARLLVGELTVRDGVGRVLVNGVPGPLHGVRSQAAAATRPGPNRVEAELLKGSRPGVWRFRLDAALEPGSLRVERGVLVTQVDGVLVFRLNGEPGERIAFNFELADEP